ncbi:hypothetical protein [Methylobacterium gossipiicola]|uniref:Uncharacterized protein n=1 Tax=Methylobacterium gossipiicola TaxID=582675 RepID=A0A1I2UH12_9HYPH|nr:hypothetical protein [Methylobacterium gossipiicola]SFG76442.1 hypothetical protein SAMN05192565_11089 [Methylobacterium gossipiicola]
MSQQPQPKAPIIRSVSSITFSIGGENPFEKAIRLTVGWMQKLNPAIPTDATDAAAFDVGGGGDHPAKAVKIEHPERRIWSATIDNPDSNLLGRTWVTEITIAEQQGQVHFGTRLLNVTRNADDPYIPSIPGFIREIIKRLPCTADGVALSDLPTYINSSEDFDWFIKLLEHPHRRLPIVVMAEAVTRPPLINLESFSRRVCGAAHVIGISNNQTWRLTRLAGRDLTVFDGALRLYRPGFKLDDADQYAHPLWLSDQGRHGFWSAVPVINRVLSSGVSKGTTDYPRFEAVRQAAADFALKARRVNSSDAEMVRLYEEENIALRQEIESIRSEHNQWLADAEAERSASEAETSELKAENHRYRIQNEMLRRTLVREGSTLEREDLTDLSNFGEWASRNISPNIWFAPKALKSIERNNQYSRPEEIGEAIRLLDEVYAPMRREPDQQSYEEFTERSLNIGITISDCFSRSGDIQRFPEYSVTYHRERLWCDQHLKKGGGTDPRTMFRIYFCWNREKGVIVIGHLPTHLDNNMTN